MRRRDGQILLGLSGVEEDQHVHDSPQMTTPMNICSFKSHEVTG